MKHPAEWWDRLLFRADELFKSDDLLILVFTHRMNRTREVSVVVARRSAFPVTVFSAYEVSNVTDEAYSQLLRIVEGGPTAGEMIVWLWHQGVDKPVEEWGAS